MAVASVGSVSKTTKQYNLVAKSAKGKERGKQERADWPSWDRKEIESKHFGRSDAELSKHVVADNGYHRGEDGVRDQNITSHSSQYRVAIVPEEAHMDLEQESINE